MRYDPHQAGGAVGLRLKRHHGAVLVVIAVAYIAFKKRYWFW